jgi:hypothetical protein
MIWAMYIAVCNDISNRSSGAWRRDMQRPWLPAESFQNVPEQTSVALKIEAKCSSKTLVPTASLPTKQPFLVSFLYKVKASNNGSTDSKRNPSVKITFSDLSHFCLCFMRPEDNEFNYVWLLLVHLPSSSVAYCNKTVNGIGHDAVHRL